MKHILRYWTNAWQKHFHLNGSAELYDAFVINANMVAFSPDAIKTFIVTKTVNKPFFIDPITHAFQHNQSFICDDNKKTIKKSIWKLIEAYWPTLKNTICDISWKDFLPKRKLEVNDIKWKDEFIEEFSRNVLDFQLKVAEWQNVDQYNKYIDYANQANPELRISVKNTPEFLVAPYFYLENLNPEWLEVNIQLINKSKELQPGQKIFWQMVLERKIIERATSLDNEYLEKIIEAYSKSNADGFLIWIDDYSEHEEIAKSLEQYVRLLKWLKTWSKGKKVYSLYWSYFSVVLTKFWILDGVCNGLEYGEARSVKPVWGWIPTAKYYFYPLHKRINESEMFRFLTLNNISNFSDVCGCDICKSKMTPYELNRFVENFWNNEQMVVKWRGGFITRHYPSTEVKENSLKHYLYMKDKEFKFVEWNDLTVILAEFKTNQDLFRNYFNTSDISHLQEWKTAIENIPADPDIEDRAE